MRKKLTVLLVSLTMAIGLFTISASAEDEYPRPKDIDIPQIVKNIAAMKLP